MQRYEKIIVPIVSPQSANAVAINRVCTRRRRPESFPSVFRSYQASRREDRMKAEKTRRPAGIESGGTAVFVFAVRINSPKDLFYL
jgi:hypothetical protein